MSQNSNLVDRTQLMLDSLPTGAELDGAADWSYDTGRVSVQQAAYKQTAPRILAVLNRLGADIPSFLIGAAIGAAIQAERQQNARQQ